VTARLDVGGDDALTTVLVIVINSEIETMELAVEVTSSVVVVVVTVHAVALPLPLPIDDGLEPFDTPSAVFQASTAFCPARPE